MKKLIAAAMAAMLLAGTMVSAQLPNATLLRGKEAGVASPVRVSALSTAVQTIKVAPGVLDSYYCYNPDTVGNYVQIFDTTAAVTLGTTQPKWSIGIPAGGAANLSTVDIGFANGIKVAATTGATNSSAPAVAVDCNFGVR